MINGKDKMDANPTIKLAAGQVWVSADREYIREIWDISGDKIQYAYLEPDSEFSHCTNKDLFNAWIARTNATLKDEAHER